jgi:hypothetical protein
VSEREYLIAKAERNTNRWKDPAYTASAGTGLAASGGALYGLHKHGQAMTAAGVKAAQEGQSAKKVIGAQFAHLPKRYKVALGTGVGANTIATGRGIQLRRRARQQG